MTYSDTFAANDQPDGATLSVNGVTYVCNVHLDATNETSIRAVCMARRAPMGSSVVFRNVVAVPAGGSTVDCPKIIARGDHFVVHWIETTNESTPGSVTLHRAVMDMASFSMTTWDYRGSTTLFEDGIYDVCPVEGHATDYVVARKTSASQVPVVRYNGWDWVDTVWVTNTGLSIASRVLGVIASDTDGDVLIAWQGTGGAADQLWCTRVNSSTGGGLASTQAFTDFDAGQFYSVGMCRRTADRVVIVAEFAFNADMVSSPEGQDHWFCAREINTSTPARVSNEHGSPHFNLRSRPWLWDGQVYCLVAYKSITDPDNWHQSRAFVVNLRRDFWDESAVSTEIRPQIMATASSIGVPDGRISTASIYPAAEPWSDYPRRRMNHAPSPITPLEATGPWSKTVCVPAVVFARISVQRTEDTALSVTRSEFVPVEAGVVNYKVHMEDPWVEVPSVVENFKGEYPYATAQCTEIGRSLVFGGGCPGFYDGTNVAELGYPWAPECLRVTTIGAASLVPTMGLSQGQYQVYFVFVYVDEQGQTHRSAPSKVFTFNVASDNRQVQYRVRTMSGSTKGLSIFNPTGRPIAIEVYRTTVFDLSVTLADPDFATSGGNPPVAGTFYRVFGDNRYNSSFLQRNTPANDPKVMYVDITDEVDDATLIYQGLGPYQFSLNYGITPSPPQAVPSMSVVTTWKNRLWMFTGEDDAVAAYSKEVRPDYGSDYYQAPELSDVNTFRLDHVQRVTAAAPLGDVLVVFTRSTIGLISGEGNDDLGTGGNLAYTPRHSGTGCINPRSIVQTPRGIFFQAAKGYYLLDAGYNLDFVSAGASVTSLVEEAGNVQGAVHIEDRHQVRIVCNGRPGYFQTIVYSLANPLSAAADVVFTFTVDGSDVEVGPIQLSADASVAEAAVLCRDAINAAAQPDGGLWEHVLEADLVGSNLRIRFQENEVADVAVSDGDWVLTIDSDTTILGDAHPMVLIYDYEYREWTTAELNGGSPYDVVTARVTGTCAWHGYDNRVAHVVLHEGALHIEKGTNSTNPMYDGTEVGDVPFSFDVKSSWVMLNGISGMKRLYEVGVTTQRLRSLGMGPNLSSLSAELEYDVDGEYSGESPAMDAYSWSPPDVPSYLSMRPGVQRLSGVRVRVYETSGAADDSFALVSFAFRIGSIRGSRHTSPTSRGT